MTGVVHFIPHLLSGPTGVLYAAVLLVLSFALMFAGRSTVKGLAFLVVGLAGAAVGGVAGTVVLGILGTFIGAIAGFVVGGLIGLLLVQIGIGLALGYFGYLIVRDLTHIFAFGVIAGIIFLVAGIAVTNKVMELATAILGGVIFYGVLTFFGLVPLLAAIVAVVTAAIGYLVQRETSMSKPGPKLQGV